MKNEVSIKEFQDFDVGDIYKIVRQIYLTSGFMSDDFDRKFPSIAHFNKHFLQILEKRSSFFLVAISQNKPVGYLVLEANPAKNLRHTATLNMGVTDKFRGMGVGKYLLGQSLQKAKDDGCTEIVYLMVRADHGGAIQLYKNAGFHTLTKLEKDTKINNEYFDGLLMRKFILRK